MVKIEDVAKLARVSPSTVSRALARPEMVAAGTRDRVIDAARSLGYTPNPLAQSLRKRSSRLIGVIVTDILNPFHATLAKGVQDAAEEHEYRAFVFNSDESPAKEASFLRELQSHFAAGLILVPTVAARENLNLVPGLPVVELDRSSGTPGVSRVLADNVRGARSGVEHLLRLGHRRVAMITGPAGLTTADERLEGYLDALRAAGIRPRPEWIASGEHHEEGAYRAARRLLDRPASDRPTALFVGNNEMAAGAITALRDLGLEMPEDVSVVGFDDSRWAAMVKPSLTVVVQPTYQMGYAGGELLISRLRSKRAPRATQVRMETELVVRSSTAPPRNGALESKEDHA